ncbi:MAG: oligosaccharide flippase family protein [Chloroflexi bacterium]|nr:oligosaccharide flippase family protein [Chloroflexota bacterium]
MNADFVVPTVTSGAHTAPLAKVGANTVWLVLSRLTSQLAMLALAILVARRLGQAGLGQYTFVTSLVYVANMVTTFGTDTLLIREIACNGKPAPTLTAAVIWIQLTLSAFFIAIAVVLPTASAEAGLALRIYVWSLVPLAFITIFGAILRANERMDAVLALNASSAILQMAFAFVAVALQSNLEPLVLALLAAQTTAALAAAAITSHSIRGMAVRFSAPVAELAAAVRAALPLALVLTTGVLFQRITILILPSLAGDSITGSYAAAARVVEGIKLVPQAMFGALFPVLARVAQNGLWRLMRKPLAGMAAFGAAAAVGLSAVSAPLIDLAFGARFAAAAGVLPILVWIVVPYAMTATASLALIAERREIRVLFGNCAGLGIAILLLTILVPRFGLAGAAWAALTAETAQALVFLALVRPRIREP